MNLLECTKVNTFFEFTKQNGEIFKKKLFVFVNAPELWLCHHSCSRFLIGLTDGILKQNMCRIRLNCVRGPKKSCYCCKTMNCYSCLKKTSVRPKCKKNRHFTVKKIDTFKNRAIVLMSHFEESTKFTTEKHLFRHVWTSDRRVDLASGKRARYRHLDKS